jgi:transcriptional antiterminator RfaH
MHTDVVNARPATSIETVQTLAWFCLRSQPKHERIAAQHLRQYEDVEVFNPRLRFMRPTRVGPAQVTESLFPNYLFAKFDLKTSLAKVHYAPGVSRVVHFGDRWPTIPDPVIEDIRSAMGPGELRDVPFDLAPGDTVNVAGGVFHGLQAVISQVMPAQQRVIVLMDFLGRQATVVLGSAVVVKHRHLR